MKYLAAFAAIYVLLAPLSFSATCAADAYGKACSFCPFDASGKMDQSCYGGYKASGTACTSASYPIMAAKYAKGECPAVDACASELSACTSQYSSGNDSADCQEGSLAICFASADQCAKSAAIKCGEIGQSQCAAAPAFVLLFGLLGYGKLSGRF